MCIHSKLQNTVIDQNKLFQSHVSLRTRFPFTVGFSTAESFQFFILEILLKNNDDQLWRKHRLQHNVSFSVIFCMKSACL